MRFKQTSLTWILVLLAQSGVLCSTWGVNYQQRRICAVRGSSVVIPCSFDHPGNQRVRRALWLQIKANSHEVPIVYVRNAKTKSRFHYIGDECHNCSLKIHQLQQKDAGKYAFRFVTNAKGGDKRNGSTLKIVDLKVLLKTNQRGDRTVKEGDSLSLTCINACDSARASSSFTWFKNGRRVKEGPVHHLTNVSSTDSGNYTCSLSAHTGTTSGVRKINVEYGPKNTLVSVRLSVEVDVSSNITLTCSSQANPPVKSYVWFEVKEDHVVEVKQGPVLVTDVEGQFLCSASNKHGSQNSSVVTVKIEYEESKYWATFTSRDIFIIAGAAVLLIGTAVICIWRLSRKRKWKLETDCGGNLQNEDYVNWLGCESNRPQDGNHSEAGGAELVYVTLDFNHRRRLNRKQPIGSHANTGVIHSTVCRNIQHPLHMQSSTGGATNTQSSSHKHDGHLGMRT